MRSDLLLESETLELKKSLAELKEGLVSMVAMLNKHGTGELWFGVAPSGAPVGLAVTDKTLRDLSQAIAAHVEPKVYPEVSAQQRGDKTCIRVRFSGPDAPYFAYGRAWMRVADEDRQLSARALQHLIVEQHRLALRWDSQPCDVAPGALDEAKIRRFVERAGLPWDSADNALAKLELVKDGRVLNAARLMFAKAASIQLRCAVFANTDSATLIDRHDFDGDLLELIDEAQKYILKNIHIGMRLEGMLRVDVPEISMAAVREAVVNAFCHRDWRDPDYIHVAVFKDRVEIRNPGLLLDGLTIEDIRQGNVSRRRNPLIADLLRRIQLIEAWGRGMPLMLQNAPTVGFRQIAGLFVAVFGRPSFGGAVTPGTAQETVQETVQERTEETPILSAQAAILALLIAEPQITRKVLAAKVGLSDSGVKYHLTRLRASGRVRHVGPTKAGRWEVVGAGDSVEAGRDGA
ncbi:ATP-binding protein [Sphaerotilus sp.]|uniref:ATP-binding protein n=1 Tax=Sphaerotilus sp. TaxID=2093942 RepID=UPI002ACF0090|nr:ATP-binding protein [Sphaerotilus sp.]MDZ7857670.1 ATP-binding protein [Sphaerotilus sp.]